jgi:VIT1/CCC1 family predicted Fe2+/Mn2+ transporter
MNVETVTRTIQLVVAPVVMVTACAILLGGLLQRYAAINDRLRAMSRERFDMIYAEQRASARTPRQNERLTEIDFQVPLLLRRHRLAHAAVLAIYSAVAVLIGDMVVIALAVVVNTDWFAVIVLVLFLVGLLLLLIGVLYTAAEVWSSHQAVEYEVNRVSKLPDLP